jgi:pimeloyl-ACP methyl ester carboxylesterase
MEFIRQGLRFDVRTEGPSGADTVVLLHGFPQNSSSWEGVWPLLVSHGYAVQIPDQRGYSPDARPRGRRAYRLSELVDDIIALADQAHIDRFHLVGHDWGAVVAWELAARRPERLLSLAVVSTPHPRALVSAILTSRQARKSWYIAVFQLPWLPEHVLLAHHGRRLHGLLVRTGMPAEHASAYVRQMCQPGALTAALNWYRALPWAVRSLMSTQPLRVPTTYIWSSGDFALGRTAAHRTARWVTGSYEFVEMARVSHWVPEEMPGQLAALLRQHLDAHRAWSAEG